MIQFGHKWNDIQNVHCSVWGCKKDFLSLMEYWEHRMTSHVESMSNIYHPAELVKAEKIKGEAEKAKAEKVKAEKIKADKAKAEKA